MNSLGKLSKASLSIREGEEKKWQLLVVQGVHCDFLIYFGLAVQPRERGREEAREGQKFTDLCGRRETVMMSNELPRCLSNEIRRQIETKTQKATGSNAERGQEIQKKQRLTGTKRDGLRYRRRQTPSVCVGRGESWKSPATGHALNS